MFNRILSERSKSKTVTKTSIQNIIKMDSNKRSVTKSYNDDSLIAKFLNNDIFRHLSSELSMHFYHILALTYKTQICIDKYDPDLIIQLLSKSSRDRTKSEHSKIVRMLKNINFFKPYVQDK